MLRTAKTTGILLTALLFSYSIYLYSSLVILRTVFFLSYFENSCYLSYFWQTVVFYLCMYLHYWLVFLPLLLVTYMRHAFYLELLFRQLTERNFRRCDAVTFYGPSAQSVAPVSIVRTFRRDTKILRSF